MSRPTMKKGPKDTVWKVLKPISLPTTEKNDFSIILNHRKAHLDPEPSVSHIPEAQNASINSNSFGRNEIEIIQLMDIQISDDHSIITNDDIIPSAEVTAPGIRNLPKPSSLPNCYMEDVPLLPEIIAKGPDWLNCFSWEQDIQRVNREVFRNHGFKNRQREIINAVMSKKDVFVRLPTGGGKSLIYQISGYLLPGMTIIIMPLTSLISDQVDKLKKLNIPAAYIDTDDAPAIRNIYHNLITKSLEKFLFITPERLLKGSACKNLLKELEAKNNLCQFVIDEAHCISSYGDEFRPEYKELSFLRQTYPNIPILCLSATVTRKMILEIESNLGIKTLQFIESTYRANLFYEVIEREKDYKKQIADLINDRYNNQTGIIYYNNRKKCEDLCNGLTHSHGLNCKYYHADLSKEQKKNLLEDWQKGKIKIIIATSAFGMGIDNASVRFVIHYRMPKSLLDYYQESGRAGRDNKYSECVILYKPSDFSSLYYFIRCYSEEESLAKELNEIYKMLEYCQNRTDCRKKILSEYFDSADSYVCNNMCDCCRYISMHNIEIFEHDFTADAELIYKVVKNDVASRKLTYNRLVDLLKGKKNTLNEYQNSFGFGRLKILGEEIDRIVLQMLMNGLLKEKLVDNGHKNFYIRPDSKFPNWEQTRIVLKKIKAVIDNESALGVRLDIEDNESSCSIEELPYGPYGRLDNEDLYLEIKYILMQTNVQHGLKFDQETIEIWSKELEEKPEIPNEFNEQIRLFKIKHSLHKKDVIEISDDDDDVIELPFKRGRDSEYVD